MKLKIYFDDKTSVEYYCIQSMYHDNINDISLFYLEDGSDLFYHDGDKKITVYNDGMSINSIPSLIYKNIRSISLY